MNKSIDTPELPADQLEASPKVASTSADLADVQASADKRELAIDHVGIKSLRHPLSIRSATGAQPSVGTFSLGVALPHHTKGTHMSRFVRLIAEHQHDFDLSKLDAMLRTMLVELEANQGAISVSFTFFMQKTAPVSGEKSLMEYPARLSGEIDGDTIALQLEIVVAATSLCPCSKEISDYGAHNQRSHLTLNITPHNDSLNDPEISIESLIKLAESEASAELYAVLKRPDEKFVTEHAYDNPKFVEDLVRDLAARLNDVSAIASYSVEAENFESIHQHSAYARISSPKDK